MLIVWRAPLPVNLPISQSTRSEGRIYCNGLIDDGLPGCGEGGVNWICTTDYSISLAGTCGDGLGCETPIFGEPLDRMDADCMAWLYLGAGGGDPRVELKCSVVGGEYDGSIDPFTTTGADLTCGTKDDTYMIVGGSRFQIDDPAFPTHIVAEERSRLHSDAPTRYHETYAYFDLVPDIRIRDDDGTPVEFTIPGRCNVEYYCWQGQGCKNLPKTGSFSRTAMTCIPQ